MSRIFRSVYQVIFYFASLLVLLLGATSSVAESLFVSGGGGGGGAPVEGALEQRALGGEYAGSGGLYLEDGRISGGGGAYVGNGATNAQDGLDDAGGQGFGPGAQNGGDDGKGGDAFYRLAGSAVYDSVTIQGGQGGFLSELFDISGAMTNTGGRATLVSSDPLIVSGDFSLLGGTGTSTAVREDLAERYYQSELDFFRTTKTLLEHSGRAEFFGTDLSIGGTLEIKGGAGGIGGINIYEQYAVSIGGGSARLTANNLAVGGNLSLSGGNSDESTGSGNGGDARLQVQNSLLVQGNFAIRAGNGSGMDLQDIIEFQAYLFGRVNGGAALATAGQAEIYGNLSLVGGGDGSAAGGMAEERAGEYLGLIIERLSAGQYNFLGYETYEDFVPQYGDLDSLAASGLLGLTGFTAAPALFSATTISVHGTVSLQGGLGIGPFTSTSGRYATGLASNGGAAVILARDLSVGQNLLVLGGERIDHRNTPGDARIVVENSLNVGANLVLQSSQAMSYTYDYAQGESRSAQIDLLQDYIDFESYIYGGPDSGGVAYVQASVVEVGGDLSISGNTGATTKMAEDRFSTFYQSVFARESATDSTVIGNGARAELRADTVTVAGNVSLQGGNGAPSTTSNTGRYAAPADGGAALLYAVSLETTGDISLQGGDYASGNFSSRPGQALLVLEQDLQAGGNVRLQGGNGGTTLAQLIGLLSGFSSSDLQVFYAQAAAASIQARDMVVNGNLELVGGQGHNTSLQSAEAEYADILSAGSALVTAREIIVGGDLHIQGGLGGNSGVGTTTTGQTGIGGTRGGTAALAADGTVSLYGNLYLADGEWGADAALSGGQGGAAQLTAAALAFSGSGFRIFELTRHDETLVALQRLGLDSDLDLQLRLDNSLAEQTNLGVLAFNANSQLVVTSVNNGQFAYSGLEVSGFGSRFEADAAALDSSQAQSATFILSGRLNSGSAPMLVVSGHDLALDAAALAGNTLFRGLRPGQSLALLALENGSLQDLNGLDGTSVVTSLGDVFELRLVDNVLYAQMTEYNSVNAFKALAQSRLAGTVQLNRAVDLALDSGWQAFERQLAGQADSGFTAFAATSLYHGQSKTGSHLEVDGLNLLAGLGRRFTAQAGKLDAAIFLETGFGSYNTFTNYANIMNINGEGSSRYLGAGLLARFELASGLYLEGSARLGKLHTEFESDSLGLDNSGASYSAYNWYLGAQTGLGYQADLTSNLNLDLVGRLIWTRQNASTLNLDGDDFEQEAIDSLRARLSARLDRDFSDQANAYFGLGLEYEFLARAAGSYLGTPIEAPELTGISYLAEIGLGLTLSQQAALELGAFASLGHYQGVGGNLRISFRF